MYCITDEQVEFILSDIRARGVELEDLQLNLLDHVCCIIEQQLEENGDFGQFYTTTIRRFYKDELRELEEETISLIANKNYYVMKKIMLYSGAFSAASLTAGIVLKYMHSPGAAVLITLGIVTVSLVFIPLLFALKVKETQTGKSKLLVGLGTLSAILIAIGILFKLQHWPGANVLCVLSLAILMLLFLPIYFFDGVRNPETRVNVIVTTILMVVGCGLFFSVTLTPQTGRLINIRNTKDYLRNEQMLATEVKLYEQAGKTGNEPAQQEQLSKKIYAICEDLKAYLLERETGYKKLDADFESRDAIIGDHSAHDLFMQSAAMMNKLEELRAAVAQYNAASQAAGNPVQALPQELNVIDPRDIATGYRVTGALNDFIQIQMYVLQNQRRLAML